MSCGPGFTDFRPFLPRVIAAAPGLPDVAAQNYLRDAAIRFCETTGWLERESVVPMACGVYDYPIVPVDCERVVRVVGVWIGCESLDPHREVLEEGCGFRIDALVTPDTTIWVYRDGEPCDQLRVRYVAAPRSDACRLDARLAEEWGRVLVTGALADILLLPEQPFSNPRLAAVHQDSFDDACLRARTRRLRGRTGGARRMVAEWRDFMV